MSDKKSILQRLELLFQPINSSSSYDKEITIEDDESMEDKLRTQRQEFEVEGDKDAEPEANDNN